MARVKKIKLKDPKKITTLEMEIILMEYFNFNKKIVVPCVSYGIKYKGKPLHECDLVILTQNKDKTGKISGFGTEVEIKISKADLKKDKFKKHTHDSVLIKSFYYAVPYYLEEFALTEIPAHAGLLVINKRGTVIISKKPINNVNCIKWPKDLIFKLCKLGTMRIFNLKRNIHKLK